MSVISWKSILSMLLPADDSGSRRRRMILEQLEPRVMLHSGAGTSTTQDTIVTFNTSLGSFQVELFDTVTPQTVANFLNYVTRGDYANTVVHRSVPGFIVQGGGFNDDPANNFSAIATDPAVQNEFNLSNIRGTIAMAKLSGNPNSATDQWFFNLGDNSSNLDQQNGGFTVFGRVLGAGMDVIDAIAQLATTDASAKNSAFGALPLRNFNAGQTPLLDDNHLVLVNSVLTLDNGKLAGTIYDDLNGNGQRDSTEQALAGVTVYLDLNHDSQFDAGDLSVVSAADGSYAFTGLVAGTFDVRAVLAGRTLTDPASGTLTVGISNRESVTGLDFGSLNRPPMASNDSYDLNEDAALSTTAANGVLANDADPESQSLTAQLLVNPAHGKLALKTDGTFVYTPDANFNGTDSFSYRASDPLGATATATVTLNVAAVADSPVLTPIADQTLAAGTTFQLQATATDPDGQPSDIRFSLAQSPQGMTIDAITGKIMWTPAANFSGAVAVIVAANKPGQNVPAAQLIFDITVNKPALTSGPTTPGPTTTPPTTPAPTTTTPAGASGFSLAAAALANSNAVVTPPLTLAVTDNTAAGTAGQLLANAPPADATPGLPRQPAESAALFRIHIYGAANVIPPPDKDKDDRPASKSNSPGQTQTDAQAPAVSADLNSALPLDPLAMLDHLHLEQGLFELRLAAASADVGRTTQFDAAAVDVASVEYLFASGGLPVEANDMQIDYALAAACVAASGDVE